MSIAAQAEQQEFITGRKGVLIPKIDTEELGPNEFFQFFHNTLRANIKTLEGREVGVPPCFSPPTEELVIPSSEESPLVLMRYHTEKRLHEILKEPDILGKFSLFLRIQEKHGIYYSDSKTQFSINTSDGRRLFFFTDPQRELASDSPRWLVSYGREASDKDRRALGSIATDFIELVS